MRATTLADDFPPDAPLHRVADALIDAHAHAEEDGDRKLLELIEGALLHVGRRLASESRVAVDPLKSRS